MKRPGERRPEPALRQRNNKRGESLPCVPMPCRCPFSEHGLWVLFIPDHMGSPFCLFTVFPNQGKRPPDRPWQRRSALRKPSKARKKDAGTFCENNKQSGWHPQKVAQQVGSRSGRWCCQLSIRLFLWVFEPQVTNWIDRKWSCH